MFVYLLIAAELALLWGVFWYLYVRKPKHHGHITPGTWGSYDTAKIEELALRAYLRPDEFVWDPRKQRFVRVSPHEFESIFARVAAKLDRQLSQLNVKP